MARLLPTLPWISYIFAKEFLLMRPLIGITTRAGIRSVHNHERPIDYINSSYIQAVEDAGGIPILIPILQDHGALQTLLPRLDGLLLPGGLDIEPCHYQQQPHQLTGSPNPSIDTLELAVAHWAIQEKLPTLGICRGMQLLNVALGGDLYQDLGEQYPASLAHANWDLPRHQFAHSIQIEAGSRMEKIFGQQVLASNSLHHQGINKPGKGIIISGRAEDGLPELMEVVDHPFMLAAQCHPEELYRSEPVWAKLFQAFIAACTQKISLQIELNATQRSDEYAA
jgi:putative glutamine amidotransferase